MNKEEDNMTTIESNITSNQNNKIVIALSERLICSFFHITIPLIGIIVTGLIVFSIFRSKSKISPFNIICVSKSVINLYVCCSFLFFQAPMTLGNFIYDNFLLNDIISAIQNNFYTYLQYVNVVLALNRFTAIFFPTMYSRIFTTKTVFILLSIGLLERIKNTYDHFAYECMFVYNGATMQWQLLENIPVGCKEWSTLLPLNLSFSFFVASLTLNIPTFIRVFLFYIMQQGTTQGGSVGKNSKLFLQTVLQDFTFTMDMIFMNYLSDMSDNTLWSFFCYTISGTLVHVLDGILTLIFQPWIVSPICKSKRSEQRATIIKSTSTQ